MTQTYYLWKASSHKRAIGNEFIPGVGHQAPKTQTIAWKHTHRQLLALTALNRPSAWKTVSKGGENASPTILSTPTVRSTLEQQTQPTNTRVELLGRRQQTAVVFPRCDAAALQDRWCRQASVSAQQNAARWKKGVKKNRTSHITESSPEAQHTCSVQHAAGAAPKTPVSAWRGPTLLPYLRIEREHRVVMSGLQS